jgi:hypothetical protein
MYCRLGLLASCGSRWLSPLLLRFRNCRPRGSAGSGPDSAWPDRSRYSSWLQGDMAGRGPGWQRQAGVEHGSGTGGMSTWRQAYNR